MKKAISQYLRYLKIERNASVHTINSYKIDLKQFISYCASQFGCDEQQVPLNKVDRLLIRLWLGKLSDKDLKKSSIARKVAAIRSFFKYCFKRGLIETNPAHLLIVPKKEKPLPKTTTPEDINRMLEAVSNKTPRGLQNRAILELFYSSGIRLSELVQLNIADVNLQSSQITVMGKGAKQRIVPMGTAAIKALKKHLKHRPDLFGPQTNEDAKKALFLAVHGQRIYPRAVQRIVKKYLQQASEVAQKSPHVLRHSFATHLLDNGAGIRVIKELLGHASLAATQIYTHTSVERLKQVYSLAHPRAEH